MPLSSPFADSDTVAELNSKRTLTSERLLRALPDATSEGSTVLELDDGTLAALGPEVPAWSCADDPAPLVAEPGPLDAVPPAEPTAVGEASAVPTAVDPAAPETVEPVSPGVVADGVATAAVPRLSADSLFDMAVTLDSLPFAAFPFLSTMKPTSPPTTKRASRR
jgi:hypothetical protein